MNVGTRQPDRPSTETARPASAVPAHSNLARSGRGGAGNLLATTATASSTAAAAATAGPEHSVQSRTTLTPPKAGFTGRGGAGNWVSRSAKAGEAARQEEEGKRKEELEIKVLRDVEAGLAMPPPAYRQQGEPTE